MPSLFDRIFRREKPYYSNQVDLNKIRTGLDMRFCALVLAGGRGKRFDKTGQSDKLLAQIGGVPALGHVISTLKTLVDDVMVVTRPEGNSQQIIDVANLFGADTSICSDADSGMGHTLAWGTSQVVARYDPQGIIVALGDMPFVSSATIHALMRHIKEPSDIAVPKHANRLGNPVAFGAEHFAALGRMAGDRGARQLLAQFQASEVEVDDMGIFEDIDTKEELKQLIDKHQQ
jgi:molybdenum cofactor cytidylyltransferase